MRSVFRRACFVVGCVVGSIAFIAVALLLFFSLVEYTPSPVEDAILVSDGAELEFSPLSLRVVNWNIGYAGLDSGMDFILDGGSTVNPPDRDRVEENLDRIGAFLVHQDGDVYFLQEVDRASARTWKQDQATVVAGLFPEFSSWYSRNFKAVFVPFPPFDPIGATDSGLMILSRYTPLELPVRYQLPGEFSWPTRTVHLKRCAMLIRIPSPMEGRAWCLINIHLSAYDDGSLRSAQMAFLREMIVSLYEEDHYVVVGGDWNSVLPTEDRENYVAGTSEDRGVAPREIPADWLPAGWRWCFPEGVTTNRSLDQPYVEGENMETTIDGFLVSPNVAVLDVRGYDLSFENSDHNPVAITISAAR